MPRPSRMAATLLALPLASLAHEGHGPEGAHLHGWDLLGLLALAAVVLFFIVRARK